jgi:chorismate-pyruvate lyase
VLQLSAITAPFLSSLAELGEFRAVSAAEIPEEYQVLLAHDDHMTVTVEAYHGCFVEVRVLREYAEGDVYSRASLLACQNSGKVVQFGIMRMNLNHLTAPVRAEIVSGATPLGRVLIRHNVLRHVELHRLWEVKPAALLRDRLQLADDAPIYGRSARIVVEGKPAVELLEIPRA